MMVIVSVEVFGNSHKTIGPMIREVLEAENSSDEA
jgi:hypothetical protein